MSAEQDYADVSDRVSEAVDEIRSNPNSALWSDAELAGELADAYAAHPGISLVLPGLFAVAVVRLAKAESEIARLRAKAGERS